MISLFSGTPGSGKSYHATKLLYDRMSSGGGIIANFPLSVPPGVKPKKDLRVSYWDNSDILPIRFFAYAKKYHVEGVEGQTLVVVDEAQVVWNARSFTDKYRMEWVKFFSQHRKLGFDILLIAQNDRMIDKQMRMLIEYEVKHRKLNNYGVGGGLFCFLTGRSTWFVAITYWYGGNKLRLGSEMIRYSRKVSSLYDSYRMFSGGMEVVRGLSAAEAVIDDGLCAIPAGVRASKVATDHTVADQTVADHVASDQAVADQVAGDQAAVDHAFIQEKIISPSPSLAECAPGITCDTMGAGTDELFNGGGPWETLGTIITRLIHFLGGVFHGGVLLKSRRVPSMRRFVMLRCTRGSCQDNQDVQEIIQDV